MTDSSLQRERSGTANVLDGVLAAAQARPAAVVIMDSGPVLVEASKPDSRVVKCPCSADFNGVPWRNHGKYVSCVAHASEDLLLAGLVSEAEKDTIVSTAARSACGKKAKKKK